MSTTGICSRYIKQFNVTFLLFINLAVSCSTNNGNKEQVELANDSIINVQLKALVDSTLSQNVRLQLDSFGITTSYRQGDTIKRIGGKGFSELYKDVLDVSGSYKVSRNLLTCISLEVNHRHVGNIFTICNTIMTNQIDTLAFSQLLHDYYQLKDDFRKERKDLVKNAYANRTKVHFGISRDEYNRYGEYFQRNFYEGLIGGGAYELAKPIFSKENIFVGFKIMEIYGQTFYCFNVEDNAELVRHNRSGYDGHGLIRLCYFCRLYNMEIIISYDQLNNRNKHLTAYWNDHVRIFDRN